MSQHPLEIDPYAVLVDYYDHWTSHVGDDVPFYVERALEARGPVVELGAGSGRVAIPIAEAGRDVIAVDASSAMLTEAARRADAAGVADRISFVKHDMRSFVAVPATDLVIIPFRSFLHLLTVDDQLAALDAVRRSLVPGGRLVCNFFTPDPHRIVEQEGRRILHASFTDERGRECELWARPEYDLPEQRLNLRAGVDVYDGERVVDTVETVLALRLVHRYEMEHLLARAGFRVESLLGDFDGTPYGPGRTEMIWMTRRA